MEKKTRSIVMLMKKIEKEVEEEEEGMRELKGKKGKKNETRRVNLPDRTSYVYGIMC